MNFRVYQRLRSEQGYILLFLLLMVAILTIGFLEVARYDLQYTVQQIKRDREEELIHRGVQYSRAIRKFYRKFGRYPTRVEELEDTNNYRSLRKRYKDPVTGKDFKILHLQDVQMSFNSGPTGLTPVAEMNQRTEAVAAVSGGAGGAGGVGSGSAGPQNSGDQNDASAVDEGAAAAATTPTGAMPQTQSQPQPNGQPQVFGGGAIVGVASVSKDRTIREFNRKNHYNQWQFIYDPSTDRGGLLMTPNQPPLQGVVQTNQQQSGQSGQNPAGLANTPGVPQPPQTPQQPDQQ